MRGKCCLTHYNWWSLLPILHFIFSSYSVFCNVFLTTGFMNILLTIISFAPPITTGSSHLVIICNVFSTATKSRHSFLCVLQSCQHLIPLPNSTTLNFVTSYLSSENIVIYRPYFAFCHSIELEANSGQIWPLELFSAMLLLEVVSLPLWLEIPLDIQHSQLYSTSLWTMYHCTRQHSTLFSPSHSERYIETVKTPPYSAKTGDLRYAEKLMWASLL